MTPRFETDADRRAERAVAAALAERHGWRLHKYPALHPIDYYAEADERVVANVEIKCKSQPFGDVMLDWEKYEWLLHAWLASTVPSLAVFGFVDAIGWVDISYVPVSRLIVTGRSDRGNPLDRRPAITIRGVSLNQLSYLEASER